MLQGPPQKLHISHHFRPASTVVEVAGELYLPNAGQFAESLQSVVGEHEGTVVLDFRQVTFLDSMGLKAVLDVRKQLSLQSRPLHLLLCAGSQPDHVVCISRLNMIISLIYQ